MSKEAKILIVDDNKLARGLASDILTRNNTPHQALTHEEFGNDQSVARQARLLIIDITTPAHIELIRTLALQEFTPPILAMSDHYEFELNAMSEPGAKEFINKQFLAKGLMARIFKILDPKD